MSEFNLGFGKTSLFGKKGSGGREKGGERREEERGRERRKEGILNICRKQNV